MAFDILSVAGLVAYHHNLGSGATFAENRLRGAFPYVATAAFLCRFVQVAKRCPWPYEIGGRAVVLFGWHSPDLDGDLCLCLFVF